MRRLRLTTAGESHGPGLSAILQGVPAGLTLDPEVLRRELRRRQHGFGRGRRMKIEQDEVDLRGGVRGGQTLGGPIAMWIEIASGVRSLGPIGADAAAPNWDDLCQVDDESPLRAIDRSLEPEMVALVERIKEEGDTLGGAVTVIAHNVPAGLGSHVQWDEKLDGRLAHAMMSVPAVKAVEIGSALAASAGPGSEAHDPIVGRSSSDGVFSRSSNRAGGLEGGITNGQDVVLTAYKKPISTLRTGLPSIDLDTMEPQVSQYERSDVTALPAAGVIGEAMVALVLADALLEKLGGDSMLELRAHFEASMSLQRGWPASSAD